MIDSRLSSVSVMGHRFASRFREERTEIYSQGQVSKTVCPGFRLCAEAVWLMNVALGLNCRVLRLGVWDLVLPRRESIET